MSPQLDSLLFMLLPHLFTGEGQRVHFKIFSPQNRRRVCPTPKGEREKSFFPVGCPFLESSWTWRRKLIFFFFSASSDFPHYCWETSWSFLSSFHWCQWEGVRLSPTKEIIYAGPNMSSDGPSASLPIYYIQHDSKKKPKARMFLLVHTDAFGIFGSEEGRYEIVPQKINRPREFGNRLSSRYFSWRTETTGET